MTRWDEVGGSADSYQARFDRLAAAGHSMHGEADLCSRLVPPGARVLDAGCGTGRVAIELARRGYSVVGVDVDPRMVAKARALEPSLQWLEQDLAVLTVEEPFDLVVCAGNVIPLVAPGTEALVLARLAAATRPGGRLVTGFGLDAAHLPLAAAPFGLSDYDEWCAAAGLGLSDRFATWAGEPFTGGGYAVNVHEVRPGSGPRGR